MKDGPICLVTGATSGIGKAAVHAFAAHGATLLLVCRNKEKGESVLKELQAMRSDGKYRLYVGDLSSQKDIRRLANEIRTENPKLDVMVNNAGGVFATRVLTIDDIELTFALNHLGYFLLTSLLLDQLRAAPSARIVNVSSQAHQFGRITFDDLGLEKGYNPMKSYAQSKLANLLFTYELSRILAGTTVTVNALHPGAVRTNFGKDLSGIAGFVFRRLDMFMRSPEKGAETLIWLAEAPELNGVSGKYFFDKKEIRSSKISYDREVAKRLWATSEKMTGI